MSGPWEDYQTSRSTDGPWNDYKQPVDQPQGDTSSFLTGLGKSIPSWESLKMLGLAAMGDPQASKQLVQGLYEAHKDQVHKALNSAQQGNYLEAGGHGAAAVLPVIGPAAAHAGETIGSGKINEGLGEAVGQILPFAPGAGLSDLARVTGVTKVAGAVGDAAKTALVRRALGKGLDKIPEANQAAVIQKDIDLSAFASRPGVRKVNLDFKAIKSEINDRIAQYDAEALSPGKDISPETVASYTDQLDPRYQNVTEIKDLKAVGRVKNQFMKQFERPPEYIGQPEVPGSNILADKFGVDMSPEQLPPSHRTMPATEAQTRKVQGGQRVGDKNYGEMKTPTTEAEKKLVFGLKSELETLMPELHIKNLDAQTDIYLGKVLQTAAKNTPTWKQTMIGTPAAAGIGYLAGGYKGAVILPILKNILDQPNVQQALAFAINKAQKLKVSNVSKAGLAGEFNQQGLPTVIDSKQP